MTTTLVFGDEERPEAMLAQCAGRLHGVLWDFDQWLRDETKYSGRDLQDVRVKLHEFLEMYEVSLDDGDPPLRLGEVRHACSCGGDCGRAAPPDGDGGVGEQSATPGPVDRPQR